MHDRLFEVAPGIAPPWFVAGVRFDEASEVLTYRHLKFFQVGCVQEVCTPRIIG